MDIEPETQPTHQSSVQPTAATAPVTQVDLENELREFLESGTGLAPSDDVVLEQMLLD